MKDFIKNYKSTIFLALVLAAIVFGAAFYGKNSISQSTVIGQIGRGALVSEASILVPVPDTKTVQKSVKPTATPKPLKGTVAVKVKTIEKESEPMSIAEIFDAAIKFVNEAWVIVPIIMAIVAYLKKVGVKDVWLTVSDFALGFLVGIPLQIATLGKDPQLAFAAWFSILLNAALLGLAASGLYKTGQSIVNLDQK